ncbi:MULTISPECIES: GspH/FimT family protein [unclassified Legionella]|uniref:GspH/FimT family protein n=1 Tax=unclassified Legionella TaxID=2622702 RepID=UPI0010567C55|nr:MULTISPECIES: GspH/FimT family protein [unclassified Legionella]MDI9819889.1 GspH/FimT family protein [Legionella sp. PL877]
MRNIRGITLLELLIYLGLSGFILFMCLPSWSPFLHKNQLNLVVDELNSAIHYARNMALVSESALLLAPLPHKDWSEGMILFVDNPKHQYESGDKLLYQWQWTHPGVQLSWKGFQSNDYLLFSNDLNHAALSGHFDIVSEFAHVKLVVNRFGRISKSSYEKKISNRVSNGLPH